MAYTSALIQYCTKTKGTECICFVMCSLQELEKLHLHITNERFLAQINVTILKKKDKLWSQMEMTELNPGLAKLIITVYNYEVFSTFKRHLEAPQI
jgi:hypothetical protein